MKPWKRLQPSLCLADIYGPGHVYTARAPEKLALWVGGRDDFATGHALAVAGSMPTVCAEGTVTPARRALLDEAGLPEDPPLRLYRDLAGYAQRLQEAAAAGEKIVTKHSHSPEEVPAAASSTDPKLLAFLNNKANLPAMAPPEATPRRRLVSRAEVEAMNRNGPATPFVLKVPSDLPNGGGLAVALCRNSGEIERALERFAGIDKLVCEEFLTIERNFCVTYATLGDRLLYLGGSQQIVDAAGGYLGNWLEPTPLPAEAIAVGRAVMENTVARGYHGVAGFDMGMLADGRAVVFDLNFRMNGSTPALLLQHSLEQAMGSAWVGRLATWSGQGPLKKFTAVVRRAIHAGWLLPLAAFETADEFAPTRLRGLLLGASRAEVEAKNQWLAERGLLCANGASTPPKRAAA